MKKLITLFLIVMILILPGCKRDYMFLYDTSRIIEIQIVDITGYDIVDDEMVIYSSVLLSVNNKAEFIEDFLQVKCYMKTPPSDAYYEKKAIKFVYDTGEYGFVNDVGETVYKYSKVLGEGLHRFSGNRCLDKQEFDALIEKYYKATT